ncbi:MAG: hypothetical protein DRP95_03640, partial [Candidatus Latescibacterota bacterium]
PHLVPFRDTEDEQLAWFYRGLPEKIPPEAEEDWSLLKGKLPREPIPWGRWLKPLAWWMGLFGAIWFAQFCLGAILRKQWLEHETLMVPQADVVLALVEEGAEDRLYKVLEEGYYRPRGLPTSVEMCRSVGGAGVV